MTPERDPARVLELLWRTGEQAGPRRGPRPALTLDQIVETATAIADSDGLDAVTMRRLGHALGVGAMALYTYVPGKPELLQLMLDRAYAEMPHEPWPANWRERLTALARDNRALYDTHPWAAALSPGRPPLGPGLMGKYEHELRALEGLGLDDLEMDATLTFLLEFVRSSSLAAQHAGTERRDSGMTDEQWWAAHAPVLERVLDPAAYPTAARVGTAAGSAHGGAYSADHAWEFGLQRVLDGLAALIDRRR